MKKLTTITGKAAINAEEANAAQFTVSSPIACNAKIVIVSAPLGGNFMLNGVSVSKRG